MNLLKNFLKEEDGLGTVEIILILAVLVSIAIIFRKKIIEFVKSTLDSVLKGAGEGAKVEEAK